ncbi:hypothetical protein JXO59_05390 [candidate division KSB1 bacterium]|nr:hypothetical protein [candidate division KSB1 bacterium]
MKDRLILEYYHRDQEFQYPDGRRFLQIRQMPIQVEDLARMQILYLQVANQVPSDTVYHLIPKTVRGEETEKTTRCIIPSFTLELQLVDGNGATPVPLESITLEKNSRYLLNKILACPDHQDTTNDWNALRLIDLALVEKINSPPSKRGFAFESEPERTWDFEPQQKPRTGAQICWQGAFSAPIIPVYIDQAVLNAFQRRALQHHPCETGAQLGGRLCQDGDQKYLHISGLAFFEGIGDQTQLAMPAAEIIHTTRQLQDQGLLVCGWVHSHGFSQGALSCSAVDIRNQYEKYILPYQVMLIADTATLGDEAAESHCRNCLCRENCQAINSMIKGWSLYGWTVQGSLTPISANVCDGSHEERR